MITEDDIIIIDDKNILAKIEKKRDRWVSILKQQWISTKAK